MRITTTQIRQAIAALDAASEAYRRHREGFDRYSQQEQARRTAEASAAYQRAIQTATDLVEAANIEASAEISQIEGGPDMAEFRDLIGASSLVEAAQRAPFIREDM